jgi:hypothetical protein
MQATKSIATGDKIYFFRAGDAFTVPEAGTCGSGDKPAGTDPKWINLGVVKSHDDAHANEQVQEVMAPIGNSGILGLKKKVFTKIGLDLKFVTSEVSPLAMQAFYRTGNLDNTSAQFTPLISAPPEGWLKVQRYDQDGTAHLIMDAYVQLDVTGGMKSGDGTLVEPEWTASVLSAAFTDTNNNAAAI